jgi:hypothetical protein
MFLAVISLYAAKINVYTYSLLLNYDEYVNSKRVDGDSSSFGKIVGVGVRYEDKLSYADMFFNFEISGGESTYDGMDMQGNELKTKQKGFSLLDGEIGIGKRYFYVLYGYRRWNRGKSSYEGDYDEVYYWSYFGAMLTYGVKVEGISFNPSFSIKKAINPTLKVKLGNEPLLELGSTYGYSLNLPVEYKLDRFSLFMFYKYSYWHIKASNPVPIVLDGGIYPIYEPESKTKNQYIGFGVSYKF